MISKIVALNACVCLFALGGFVGTQGCSQRFEEETSVRTDFPSFDASDFSYFKDCDTCPEMISVPMPDGRKVAFAKTEVTIGQYRACVEAGACQYNRKARFHAINLPETHPQASLGYSDAVDYVAYVSRLSGKGYRLPTFEEWSAAVSDANGVFSEDIEQVPFLGNAIPKAQLPTDLMEYTGHGVATLSTMSSRNPNGLASGGSFGPNLHGLYEMSGSLTEWTDTCAEKWEGRCVAKYVLGGSYLSNWPRMAQRPDRRSVPIDLADRAYLESLNPLGYHPDRPDYEGAAVLFASSTGARIVRDDGGDR